MAQSVAVATRTQNAEGLSSLKTESQWGVVWRRFRKHKLAVASSVLLLVVLIMSLLATWISPFDSRPSEHKPRRAVCAAHVQRNRHRSPAYRRHRSDRPRQFHAIAVWRTCVSYRRHHGRYGQHGHWHVRGCPGRLLPGGHRYGADALSRLHRQHSRVNPAADFDSGVAARPQAVALPQVAAKCDDSSVGI